MNETEYQNLAEKILSHLSDALEVADNAGTLEIEYENGALTIEISSGKQWLISRHVATRQIWLASPVSGGLHFVYDTAKAVWMLPDGRTLQTVLATELETIAHIKVTL